MKQTMIATALAVSLLGATSCSSTRKAGSVIENDHMELSVAGEITAIENGKDGYTATIKEASGKEYLATISIVNLQKHGGQYKRYNVGDKISVKGPLWKDQEGKLHITVHEMK
ncbi:hypothetical protein [Chitinophaga terrae (ex Kim and Jung 2007)]|nr:hypothetical protein [Chitinophaga terrae (ex Kim and Jung 2007)]MDQ0109028.1 lysyl-tRNA synthetase class II [Chitinophaga terrae (ex Kim and Jung 2007)]GEP91860.1 hypothetical protein CTE07_35050 [Chitinophaga terrae (ex Kim and Jung 2007)]